MSAEKELEEAVARCRSEAKAWLFGISCDEKAAVRFAQALQENHLLESFSASYCSFLGISWAIICEVLARGATLKYVECMRCDGVDLGLLAGCMVLGELLVIGMSPRLLEGIAVTLISVKSLRALVLWEIDDVDALFPSMFKSTVVSLKLHACRFSNCENFGLLLSRMETVELNGIMLDSVCAAVCRGLKGRPRELLLIHGKLSATDCMGLAMALWRNSTLEKLDLSCNPEIGATGICAIASVLKENTTLTQLNLADNCIFGEGLAELAKMLRVNTTLTHLDLAGNFLTNAEFLLISDALGRNAMLRSVSIGKFGQSSDPFLGCLMQSNGAITQLKVGGMFCEEFNGRNRRMHKRAKDALLAFNIVLEAARRGAFLAE